MDWRTLYSRTVAVVIDTATDMGLGNLDDVESKKGGRRGATRNSGKTRRGSGESRG